MAGQRSGDGGRAVGHPVSVQRRRRHYNGAVNAQSPGAVELGGTITGTLNGSGNGAVGLGGTLLIGVGGATFDFATGLFQWSGNSINLDGNTLTNTGAMTIAINNGSLFGNTSLNGGGTPNQGGTLDNQGTITQSSGYFYLYDSVSIENERTYDFTGNANINYGNDSPNINNTSTGLFEQTGGTGTSTGRRPLQ